MSDYRIRVRKQDLDVLSRYYQGAPLPWGRLAESVVRRWISLDKHSQNIFVTKVYEEDRDGEFQDVTVGRDMYDAVSWLAAARAAVNPHDTFQSSQAAAFACILDCIIVARELRRYGR